MYTWRGRFFGTTLSALLAYTLLAAGILRAQIAGNGSIQGTVLDPSGAAVPGATVMGRNVATGETRTASSSTAGFYQLAALPPGQYAVTCSARGFSTLTEEHVVVDAMSAVSLNLNLTVGLATQSVNVSATPAQVDTSNPTLGVTIENQAYAALPLVMGGGPASPDGFIALLPGVAGGAGGSIGSYPTTTINGGEAFSKIMYVNGIPLTTSRLQGDNRDLNEQIAVEAVDEFHVETNGSPAMYSGQGNENFVIKSGTNQFHGLAYESFRNNAVDARGFFATTVPIEKQNEFGASLGGPIRKNKIFFFGLYDGYRLRQGSNPAYYSIPTSAEQSGNFSALPVAIYDPSTTSCTSSGACTRQPFPNNTIPASQISPISQFLQSMLPAPTYPGLVQNNWLQGLGYGYNQDDFTIKVDANLTDKNHLFGLASAGWAVPVGTVPAGGQLPEPYSNAGHIFYYTNLGQLQDTHVFSGTLVNVFSFGFNRFYPPGLDPTNGGNYPSKAGLTGLPPGVASSAFPTIVFSGPNSPTIWHSSSGVPSYLQISNSFVYSDNVNWVHGRHSLGFGAEFHFWQDNIDKPLEGSNTYPGFTFTNLETASFSSSGGIQTTTGNAYASYLLGAVDNAGITQSAASETGGRYRQYAVFAQDDFKVSHRLTLNFGLRWEIPVPYREVADRLSFLNPTLPNPAVNGYPGALQFAGNGTDSCHCETPFQIHYADLGPRVGFAYALNDKTALRGAYNIVYINAGALGGTGSSQSTGILGFSAIPSFASPNAGITPAFNWATGFPAYIPPPSINPTLNTGFNTTTPSGGVVTVADPWLGGKAPYTENWHFTVQRQLDAATVLTVAYSGSAGHFLPTGIGRGIYSDQINPKYMALGNLLRATETPANIAAANAIVPGIQLPYPNFQGTIGQMLLPFPQYSSVSDIYQNFGNSTYHSLQVSAQRKFSRGMSFIISYTYSKEIDDAGDNRGTGAGSGRTAYNNALEKAVGAYSLPNQLVGSFVYQLPFGAGKKFNGGSPVVRGVISNWQVSGILTYASGTPLGTIGATCNVPYAAGCYADYAPGYTGNPILNGGYGSGSGNLIGSNTTVFIDKNAFANPAAYSFGTTPRTLAYGLRSPFGSNENLDVSRRFKFKESKELQIRIDAFNALNRVHFGSIGTSIASASFGKIGGQDNSPRILQLEGRFTF